MSDIEGSINITASTPKQFTCKLPKGGTVGKVVTDNYCVEQTGQKIQLQTKKGQQALLFGADALVKNPENKHLVMPGAKGFVANNVYPGDLVLPERLTGPNGEVLCRKDVCESLRAPKAAPAPPPPEPPKSDPIARVDVEPVVTTPASEPPPEVPYENVLAPTVSTTPPSGQIKDVFNPFLRADSVPTPAPEVAKTVETPPVVPAPVAQVPVESKAPPETPAVVAPEVKAPPEPPVTPAPTPKPDVLTGGGGIDVPKLFAQAKELKPVPAAEKTVAKEELRPFFKGFGAMTKSSLPSKIEPSKVVEPAVAPSPPKAEVPIEDKPILASPPKYVETSPASAHPLQYNLGSEKPSLKAGEPPVVAELSLNPESITPLKSIRESILEE